MFNNLCVLHSQESILVHPFTACFITFYLGCQIRIFVERAQSELRFNLDNIAFWFQNHVKIFLKLFHTMQKYFLNNQVFTLGKYLHQNRHNFCLLITFPAIVYIVKY
jgi:hypothetical protein